ncbi:TPA: hypothetical protein DDY55_00475 [Candidatus Falkowbacteria bacterium]|nr:hypothetical protein [Candidatus Falkowbacteria bacterium]HAY12325.1 hypothetical protein [Candidatus Falkowbacteria bacterium]HBI96582.1 hypothetical protein [Candidatus Falkowbacteria bacterium]HBT27724.1 hypothetical protein [Candidatus Falkowbacteria bacterium]HBY15192.1 hypothetical protein [Candidatus Falkowbacteria bacterium]
MPNRKKIGLVLGGGGARGIAHIGVLKVLLRENIRFDLLCGCSMGALVGSCYATGMSIEKIEETVLNLRKRDFIKWLNISRPTSSLIKGEKVFEFIHSLIGDKEFTDTILPFSVMATDLENGREVILKNGPMATAVQASISVPGIFPPVSKDGKFLIDGGVVNPTPIDTAEKMGAEIIIGVDLMLKSDVKLKNPGIITTLLQSYEIIRNQAVLHKINNTNPNTKIILICPEIRSTLDSFKFSDIGKLIESGERAAVRVVSELKNIK